MDLGSMLLVGMHILGHLGQRALHYRGHTVNRDETVHGPNAFDARKDRGSPGPAFEYLGINMDFWEDYRCSRSYWNGLRKRNDDGD
jgi:hypothetical protein